MRTAHDVSPFRIAASAVLVALLGAGPAAAQEAGGQPGMTFFGRVLSVHVLAAYVPDYMGSDDYEVAPAGSLSLLRPGAERDFAAPDDGVSLGLIGDGRLYAGVLARWRSAREDDGDLRGFEEVDSAVEAGGFVTWWPADWLRVRGEVRRGFGGNTSWAANLGADAVYRDGPWVVSAGPRVHWADEDFTSTYFEVTPADAARSPFGLQSFNPGGDFWSAGALASVEYKWRPRWSLTADLEYQRLTGDAADSPIVNQLGSEDQFRTSVGMRYKFSR
jgi:MipA family protein